MNREGYKFPELTIHCEELDQTYMLDLVNDQSGYYETIINIPMNDSGENIIYKFDLLNNGKSIGKTIEIEVDSGNNFYEVIGFYSDKTFILSPGGIIKFMAKVDKSEDDVDFSLVNHDIKIPQLLYENIPVSFTTPDGAVFFYSHYVDSGLWKYNTDTGELDQLYDKGCIYNVQFKSSSGLTFIVSGTPNYKDILVWDGTELKIAFEPTYGGYTRWYESMNGEIFVSSVHASSLGILRWNGTKMTVVYDQSYEWQYWTENSNGDIFTSSPYGTGLLYYNPDENQKKFVKTNLSLGTHWGANNSPFEVNNRLYISANDSTGHLGLFAWNPETRIWDSVYPTGYRYNRICYTKNGEPGSTVLIGADSTYGTGILMIPILEDLTNYDPKVNITSYNITTAYFPVFVEDNDGNVVIGSDDSTTNAGILFFNKTNKTIGKGYGLLNRWNTLYKTKSGKILITSNAGTSAQVGKGVVRYDPETKAFSLLYSNGSYYTIFHEYKQYTFISSSQAIATTPGILKYNSEMDTINPAYNVASGMWMYFIATNLNFYLSSFDTVNAVNNGILWFNESTGMFIKIIGDYSKYFTTPYENWIDLDNGAVAINGRGGNEVKIIDQGTIYNAPILLCDHVNGSGACFIKMSDGTVFGSSTNKRNVPGLYRITNSDPVMEKMIPYGSEFNIVYHSEYGDFIGSTGNDIPRHEGIYRYKDGELTIAYPHGHGWQYFERLKNGLIAVWSNRPQGMLIYNIEKGVFEKVDDYFGYYGTSKYGKFTVYQSPYSETIVSYNKTEKRLQHSYIGSISYDDRSICIFNADKSKAAIIITEDPVEEAPAEP